MNKELEITKEKLNTLEQAWENVRPAGKETTALVGADFISEWSAWSFAYLEYETCYKTDNAAKKPG